MGGVGFLVSPQVMHETVDGETHPHRPVVGHLLQPAGFGAGGLGCARRGASASGGDRGGARSTPTTPEPGAIEASVAGLVRQLESEGLIAPERLHHAASVPALEPVAGWERSRSPSSRSTRTCRTSSCSIPCTRVDDAGWPHAAPVATDGA